MKVCSKEAKNREAGYTDGDNEYRGRQRRRKTNGRRQRHEDGIAAGYGSRARHGRAEPEDRL